MVQLIVKGGIPLKSLVRLLIVLTIVLVIGISLNLFFTEDNVLVENEKEIVKSEELEIAGETSDEEIEVKRPEQGVSTFIGKNAEEFRNAFGKPARIEPSYYDYDWWVYNNEDYYLLAGILDQKVVTIVVAGQGIDTYPFVIGESLESIYQKFHMQPEIELKMNMGFTGSNCLKMI